MTAIAKYFIIVCIIFVGMWQLLSIADRAYYRVDIECQEGC